MRSYIIASIALGLTACGAGMAQPGGVAGSGKGIVTVWECADDFGPLIYKAALEASGDKFISVTWNAVRESTFYAGGDETVEAQTYELAWPWATLALTGADTLEVRCIDASASPCVNRAALSVIKCTKTSY